MVRGQHGFGDSLIGDSYVFMLELLVKCTESLITQRWKACFGCNTLNGSSPVHQYVNERGSSHWPLVCYITVS